MEDMGRFFIEGAPSTFYATFIDNKDLLQRFERKSMWGTKLIVKTPQVSSESHCLVAEASKFPSVNFSHVCVRFFPSV